MTARRRYPVVTLAREAGQVMIDWPDGHHSEYDLATLREACPCAECNAYRNNPDPLRVRPAASTQMQDLRYVGNYAIQFVWSDGHSFGIYTWDMLRRMCNCPICRGGTESE